ncbi:MAG: hypothetical protein NW703_01815 [Nitrospiraceae bacterium]
MGVSTRAHCPYDTAPERETSAWVTIATILSVVSFPDIARRQVHIFDLALLLTAGDHVLIAENIALLNKAAGIDMRMPHIQFSQILGVTFASDSTLFRSRTF